LKHLRIENLCFHDLGPLNMEVDICECAGLVGPSGMGKSLFLRAVADLDPHTGSVFLAGRDSAALPAHEWRKKVGYLPAESAWWFDTVAEHFSEIQEDWLETLNCPREIMQREVSRISSGERQRLALLRLLMNRPQVLLLDEPTANLDAENEERVEKLLEIFRKEFRPAVIWVSHNREQVRRVAHQTFLLGKKGLEKISQSRSLVRQ
jgi:ABC-type iron transport system FetAB ATPase subunit